MYALTAVGNRSISGWCIVAQQLKQADVYIMNIVTSPTTAKVNEGLFIQTAKSSLLITKIDKNFRRRNITHN